MKKNKIILTMSVLFILVLGVLLSNKHDYKVLDKEISSDLSSKKIVVLGSEPEAITAAVMAARLGYSVDMITEDEKLGGLFTRGMLTALDLNYYNKNKILHEGFFREFYENASNGYNLDLNKTQNFFDEVVKHKNITLVKEVDNITPVVDSNNKDELAVVKLTTSKKGIPIKTYRQGKSKIRPFVETRDFRNQPIKRNKYFLENKSSYDFSKYELSQVKKLLFKTSKNSKLNSARVRKLKDRK